MQVTQMTGNQSEYRSPDAGIQVTQMTDHLSHPLKGSALEGPRPAVSAGRRCTKHPDHEIGKDFGCPKCEEAEYWAAMGGRPDGLIA
jgi:hypothetical protein